MVDGSAVLMTMFWPLRAIGLFDENHRGTNLLDTGAHFYDVYECADGKYISIGSIEPQFYAELLRLTGLQDDPEFAQQMDKALLAAPEGAGSSEMFRQKTRDEWCALMEHTDVCFAPVLTMSEAAAHPHNVARDTFVEVGGMMQPAPAPRFCRTTVRHPAARRPIRGSTPVRCWPTGASTADRRRQARSRQGSEVAPMATLVCFHAHPDDESHHDRRHHGPSRGRAGHRVVLVVATDGRSRRGARRPRAGRGPRRLGAGPRLPARPRPRRRPGACGWATATPA